MGTRGTRGAVAGGGLISDRDFEEMLSVAGGSANDRWNAFHKYVGRKYGGEAEDVSRDMIQGWANSSQHNWAAPYKVFAADRLGSPVNRYQDLKGKPAEHAARDALDRFATNRSTTPAVVRKIVQEKYEFTQRLYARDGVTAVTVYRGTRPSGKVAGRLEVGGTVSVDQAGASSWTTSFYTAHGFAIKNDGVVLERVIRVRDVISSERVGTGEGELIVAGRSAKSPAKVVFVSDQMSRKRFVKKPAAVNMGNLDDTLENADWIKRKK